MLPPHGNVCVTNRVFNCCSIVYTSNNRKYVFEYSSDVRSNFQGVVCVVGRVGARVENYTLHVKVYVVVRGGQGHPSVPTSLYTIMRQ